MGKGIVGMGMQMEGVVIETVDVVMEIEGVSI